MERKCWNPWNIHWVRLYKPEWEKHWKMLTFGFGRVVLSYLTSLTGFSNLFGLEALLCKNVVRIIFKHSWVKALSKVILTNEYWGKGAGKDPYYLSVRKTCSTLVIIKKETHCQNIHIWYHHIKYLKGEVSSFRLRTLTSRSLASIKSNWYFCTHQQIS